MAASIAAGAYTRPSFTLLDQLTELQSESLLNLDHIDAHPPTTRSDIERYKHTLLRMKEKCIILREEISSSSDPSKKELLDKVQRIFNGTQLLYHWIHPFFQVSSLYPPAEKFFFPLRLPPEIKTLAGEFIRFAPIYRKPLPYYSSERSKLCYWKYGPSSRSIMIKTLTGNHGAFEWEFVCHAIASSKKDRVLPLLWASKMQIATPFEGSDLTFPHHYTIPFKQEDYYGFVMDLVEILSGLQEREVVHCDIKPANLIMTYDKRINVFDFGLARRRLEPTSIVGTDIYMAPEVWLTALSGIKNLAEYSRDVWAVGMVIWYLITQTQMFTIPKVEKDVEIEEARRIKARAARAISQEDIDRKIDEKVDDPDLRDLLKGMLQIEPRLRIKVPDMVKHPYVKKAVVFFNNLSS